MEELGIERLIRHNMQIDTCLHRSVKMWRYVQANTGFRCFTVSYLSTNNLFALSFWRLCVCETRQRRLSCPPSLRKEPSWRWRHHGASALSHGPLTSCHPQHGAEWALSVVRPRRDLTGQERREDAGWRGEEGRRGHKSSSGESCRAGIRAHMCRRH